MSTAINEVVLEDHALVFLGACILASNGGYHHDGSGDVDKFVNLAKAYYDAAKAKCYGSAAETA